MRKIISINSGGRNNFYLSWKYPMVRLHLSFSTWGFTFQARTELYDAPNGDWDGKYVRFIVERW